jgi:hypothetical protein
VLSHLYEPLTPTTTDPAFSPHLSFFFFFLGFLRGFVTDVWLFLDKIEENNKDEKENKNEDITGDLDLLAAREN